MQLRAISRPIVAAAVAAAAAALVYYVPSSAGTSWTAVGHGFAMLPVLTVGMLAVLWMAGLICNSVALAASLPGLTTRRALTLSLTGSAVANVLPLGGAAGVGLNYAMTRRWGFSGRSVAAYLMTTNVFDVASKLVVIAAASTVLLIGGGGVLLHQGISTALELLILLPVLASLLLHQRSAAALGRVLDHVIAAVGRLLHRRLCVDLASRLPRLSQMTTTLIRQRWRRLTVGTLAYAALQAALLWVCMHVVGLDLNAISLAGALAVDRLLTLLPLTPGGVGLVEGGMAAALTALGASPEPVVAGVLLYRGFTYLAEIPVGGLTALAWSLFQRRTQISPSTVALAAGSSPR